MVLSNLQIDHSSAALRVAQTRIFVGRRMQAIAAATSEAYNQLDVSAKIGGSFFWMLLPAIAPFCWCVDFSACSNQSQGQYASAMTVNVVSTELERVLTEQNHCHGLSSVKASAARDVWLRGP